METKLLPSLSAAMKAAGLRDGMTISFHHHLRNGDYILNLVLEEAARMGVRDLTVNASSLFDIHMPIVGPSRNGVVTRLLTDDVSGGIGRHLSQGVLHCARCRGQVGGGVSMPLSPGALAGARYIVGCSPKRLFSFALPEEDLRQLGQATEAFLMTQQERGFRTLDYYKSLLI